MAIVTIAIGWTCVYRFSHLTDPCKKQAETEVNLLVNTRTPREASREYQMSRHKFCHWAHCQCVLVFIYDVTVHRGYLEKKHEKLECGSQVSLGVYGLV